MYRKSICSNLLQDFRNVDMQACFYPKYVFRIKDTALLEAKTYKLEELARMCKDAYKRLNAVEVMQLFNGQRNMSGMDMRRLDLSDIDFRGSSFYRARLDGACLQHSNLSGKDVSLVGASLVGVDAPFARFSGCVAQQSDFSKAVFSIDSLNAPSFFNFSIFLSVTSWL